MDIGKFRKARKYSKTVLAGIVLALTGCVGGQQEETPVSVETGSMQATASTEAPGAETKEETTAEAVVEVERTEAAIEASTEVITEDPFAQYPQGICGLEEYQPQDLEGYKAGDVYLAACITSDAQTEEGYFYLDGIYAGPEQVRYISYYIFDEPRSCYEDDEMAELGHYRQYLAAYDFATDTVLEKILVNADGEAAYMESAGTNICYWTPKDECIYGTLYDGKLQKQAELVREYGESGYFSADGNSCFVVHDGGVWKQNLTEEDKDERQIVLSQDYAVDYLNGIFSDAEGVDYAVASGVASDLKNYTGIINLQTGELIYLQSADSQSVYAEGGLLFGVDFMSEGPTEYDISYQKQNPVAYTWTGEGDASICVLDGGNVLFYMVDADEQETRLHIELYDVGARTLLGSTTFIIPEINMWFSGVPFVLDGELVMPMQDLMGNSYFYRWDYAASDCTDAQMSVTDAAILDEPLAQIEFKWNPTELVPKECPLEFSFLREKADALEEQYGVQIYISEECGSMFGGYAVVPLSDYEATEQALDQLEHEMEKYPAGFFAQFAGDWVDGIDIYVAGLLIGMEDDVLDYAGGFQTIYQGRYALVIDATSLENVGTTFHHEMCHAIEEKIEEEADDDQLLLYEEAWNGLNPPENVYGASYTDTYAIFGREELLPFVYWYAEPGNAYFIDDYSLTYAKEDRARLFEYIMQDERGYLDWEDEPHLQEKINCYATWIRNTFDTTGWGNVLWETYSE